MGMELKSYHLTCQSLWVRPSRLQPSSTPTMLGIWSLDDHRPGILPCNQVLITWYSKKQSTVEVSTFGAEFIAACTCLDVVESLRFKLRMFGIPVDGPTDVLCNNNSVVNNYQRPEYVLSKKYLSICFHRVQEAVARHVIRVGKIESQHNLADLFTKCLPTPTRPYLLGGIVANSHDGIRPVDPDDSHLNRAFEWG